MTDAPSNASPVSIYVGDELYPRYQFVDIRRDIGSPDVATLELLGTSAPFSPGESVKISIDETPVFAGEVVSLSTTYGAQQQTTTLTAMNKLHRLNRWRKSDRFDDFSDQEIVEAVAAEGDITKVIWGEKTKKFRHRVVLWTDQTAMDFLAERARRYGFDFWCIGDTLYCGAPDLQNKSGFELKLGAKTDDEKIVPIASFEPRVSLSGITKSVKVTASDPVKAETIEGKFDECKSPLGDTHAADSCGNQIAKETWIVDMPVASPEEADAIAKAQFVRQSLSFITAEAEVVGGNPKFELGTTVEVKLSKGDRFNGRYYVTGITHRYVVQNEQGRPYSTRLVLARDALSGPGAVEV